MILCAPTPTAALAGLGEGSPFFRGRLIPRLSDAEREAVARGIMAIEDMHFRRLPAITAKVRALEAAASGPVPGLAELRVRLGRTAAEVTGIMLKIQEAKEEARRRGLLDRGLGEIISASTFIMAVAMAVFVIILIDRFLTKVVPAMSAQALAYDAETNQMAYEARENGLLSEDGLARVLEAKPALNIATIQAGGLGAALIMVGLGGAILWAIRKKR